MADLDIQELQDRVSDKHVKCNNKMAVTRKSVKSTVVDPKDGSHAQLGWRQVHHLC